MKSFRKCFSEARAAPGGPGGPKLGNLALEEPDTKGGVTVKELVVGRAWYQNERYEFHMACYAWLKALCIEGGEYEAKA